MEFFSGFFSPFVRAENPRPVFQTGIGFSARAELRRVTFFAKAAFPSKVQVGVFSIYSKIQTVASSDHEIRVKLIASSDLSPPRRPLLPIPSSPVIK